MFSDRPIVQRFTLALSLLLAPLAWAASPEPAKPAEPAAFVEQLATPQLLDELREGGFVLYLRHGLTDNAVPDRAPAVDLNDCSTQRPLTEEGREQVRRVGEHIRAVGIPIAELHVSPLCRARQSAAAAFPELAAQVDNNLMYTAHLTSAEKAPIIARTRELFTIPVAAGSNRLLLAHGPNLMDLMGYFPKESTLVVFRPTADGSFQYIASIPPEHWAALLD